MRETPGSLRASLQRWHDAATVGPRLAVNALGRGIVPASFSAAATLRQEGLSEIHWKFLGDALVGFLRHSGPLPAKLGQLLAVQSDWLPAPVCARLEALYSDQTPMSNAELERILNRAYPQGLPFREFDRKPIGVGSIGQVHRARLRSRRRVLVKVLRPDLARALQRDMNAARVVTDILFRLFAPDATATRALVSRTVEDLGKELAAQTNLEIEADALRDFRRRFASNPRVRVPICYRKWSSPEVLVLEELSGEPLASLRHAGNPDRARAAADLALREILAQILEEGRFHADPHGGNLLLLDDGRLGLIDLGSTGELSVEERELTARAARALLAGDPGASILALLEFGTVPKDFDLEAFKADVDALFRDHRRPQSSAREGRGDDGSNPEGGAPGLEAFLDGIFRVARIHRIQIPPATTRLIKTVVTIEGLARSLDPDLNLALTALPIFLRSLAPRWLRWSRWRRPRPTRRGIRRFGLRRARGAKRIRRVPRSRSQKSQSSPAGRE